MSTTDHLEITGPSGFNSHLFSVMETFALNDKVLLYTTGNCQYTQFLIINHNGKEYEKDYIYIYIYIHTHTHTHITQSFAVYQKLTQHCKSTILQ